VNYKKIKSQNQMKWIPIWETQELSDKYDLGPCT